jgi:hypothetical protein
MAFSKSGIEAVLWGMPVALTKCCIDFRITPSGSARIVGYKKIPQQIRADIADDKRQTTANERADTNSQNIIASDQHSKANSCTIILYGI